MSKLNDHSLTPPFQYSSVNDLAALVTPECWIATCDVEAFYHRFSIALLWRFLFGFMWGHLLYYFCVVVFGFGPAPYYASGWSAEFYRWTLHKQIPATVFMDDWATVGADQSAAQANRRAIKDLLSPCGISFSNVKDTTRGLPRCPLRHNRHDHVLQGRKSISSPHYPCFPPRHYFLRI